MPNIYYLQLPSVPPLLYEELIEFCKIIPLNEKNRLWLNDFHNKALDVASFEYVAIDPVHNNTLHTMLTDRYQGFFPGAELIWMAGKITNVIGRASQAPPHCDRGRRIAINYILRTGGNSVKTCFFKETRCEPCLKQAENQYHHELTRDFEVIFPARQWHAYDVQTFHSVENIESQRFLLSMILRSNPTIDQFVLDHSHLIQNHQP